MRLLQLSVQQITALGLFFFVLCAIMSIGQHQADEYFQVIEFAQFKLGLTQLEELPWEYAEMMRPSIQALIAAAFIKLSHLIGIDSPFIIAGLLRLLSALLLFFAISRLNKAIISFYSLNEKWSKILLLTSYLIFFMPYLSVRFSSENYSAAFFLLSLPSLLKSERSIKDYLIFGILMGIAILFRYQIAIVGLAILLHALIIAKDGFLKPFLAGIVILILLYLGFLLDSYFYGEQVSTAWNYLRINLIEGKASSFGIKPFYYYFTESLLVLIPPLSILLLAAAFNGIRRLIKDKITWAFLAFLLLHSLIAHKEMRFLFPMAYPFVFLVVYGLRDYYSSHELKWKGFINFCLTLNFVVLIIMTLKPADDITPFYRYLWNNTEGKSTLIISKNELPFHKKQGLNSSFYHPGWLKEDLIDDDESLTDYLKSNQIDHCYFFHDELFLKESSIHYTFTREYSLIPNFLSSMDPQGKVITGKSIYFIQRK